MKFSLFSTFILIRLSLCLVYVDLKDLFISEGVVVHHGYFITPGSKYLMFVGDPGTIEVVRYGDVQLYPKYNPEKEFKVIVEYFDVSQIFVNIHISEKNNENEYFNLKYIIEDDKESLIKMIPLHIRSMIVHISLDISENSKKHPFVYEQTTFNDNEVEIKYGIIKGFRGFLFNRRSYCKYVYGHIYDSTNDIIVGHAIFKSFYTGCDFVTVKNGQNCTHVYIHGEGESKEFTKTLHNNKHYWLYTGNKTFMRALDKKTALYAYFKIEVKPELIKSVNLDLSEKLSPEYHQIEKTTGKCGPYDYTIYHSKDKSDKIQNVIDCKRKVFKLLATSYNQKVLRVEKFHEPGKTLNVLNYTTQSKNRIEYFYKIYEHVEEIEKYLRLPVQEEIDKLKLIREMYPVKLDVDIDEESKRIYENVILTDNVFRFQYFYINEYDNEVNLREKYIFGSIYEINPYNGSNIPEVPFVRSRREIRSEINANEFIIRNPFVSKPIHVEAYEIYRIIS